MKCYTSLKLACIATVIQFNLIVETRSYLVDDNPYRHFITLDKAGKYQLEWLVDWDQKMVTFNVTVATKGYVGFGLAKREKMIGADIVIGGVYPNGKSYFTDRHAIANQLPEIDPKQDWTLHHAWERGGQTFLSFSRPFDTCDKEHDLPITDDTITILWAYSEVDDQLQYHFQTRGGYDVYLLDPDLVPRTIDPKVQKGKHYHWKKNYRSYMSLFRMTASLNLPTQDTAYWCTFHKVPTTTKHHIIGWNTVFPSEKDRTHVHHLVLHRCHAPAGVDPEILFGGPARSEGSECYFLEKPNPLPTQYCREVIHAWGLNGRAVFFPEHVGLPMSEKGPEYFVLQVHYDNPNLIPDLNITVNMDAYYTDNLRENDAGLMQVGELTPGSTSLMIPPSSLEHVIVGHCAGGCTEKILPAGGVKVFAAFLHTHISGIGVKLQHLRGTQEMPWLLSDENYNFNYQQFRILRQERKLMPKDLLLERCVYDTSSRNGSVVVGGFSTREEMCTGFIYYYSRAREYSLCRSEIRTEEYCNLIGIRNTTWDQSRRQVIITSPSHYAGLSVVDYANNYIHWDLEMREKIQRHHLYAPQVSQCPRADITPSGSTVEVEYYDDDDFEGLAGRSRKHGLGAMERRLQRYSPKQGYTETRFPIRRETLQFAEPEFVSVNPRGIPRYRRPAQCSSKSQMGWHMNSN